jgi:alpha-N-acetylglucosamine transferase
MFVSLISGGSGYLNGCLALAASLKLHEPGIPRMLLVEEGRYSPEDVAKAAKAGWCVVIVAAIRPKMKAAYKAKRWPNTLTKLHVWNVDADMVVYLDADCLVMRPVFHAITNRSIKNLAACWVKRNSHRFNSGVMALRPDKRLYQEYCERVINENPNINGVSGSDQCFLNLRIREWTRIPDRFNNRNWSRFPEDLGIAHIRPHPWGKKGLSSSAYKKITATWREFVAQELGVRS